MSSPYIVMRNHRKIWHYQFMRENTSGIQFFICFLFILLNLGCMFRAVLEKEDVLEKLELLASLFCLVGGIGNFAVSFPNHRILYDTVAYIQKHYDEHKSIPEDRLILDTCHGEADRMFKAFGITIVCTGFGFATVPVLIYFYHIYFKGQATVMLPFEAVYPWELEGMKLFLSYLLQIIVMAFILSMVIMNVATPVSLSMAIISHFKIAQRRFEAIKIGNSVESLKVAIKCHQAALELLIDVRKVENGKIFLQVITTAIALSMCMFRLSKATSVETLITFGTVTWSVVAHLYLLCFYGQKVSNEGTILYEVMTSIPWNQQPLVFKKMYQFCIMRARKTERLSAWNIADISFESFNAVMTTSFSYLTFLQAVSQ